jgi:hypothetical protein
VLALVVAALRAKAMGENALQLGCKHHYLELEHLSRSTIFPPASAICIG